jgi:hypothetical protein
MTYRIQMSCCMIFALVAAVAPTDSYAAKIESRAYINSSCIIADEPFLLPESDADTSARMAPLFGALAAKLANTLISGIISGVAGGIDKRGARKNTEYVTANNVNLFAVDLSGEPFIILNPQFGCATIVTGEIHPSAYDCKSEYIPRDIPVEFLDIPESDWVSTRTDNSVENILRRANVCVVGDVRSAFEARIVLSDDGSAYRVDSAGYTLNSLMDTKSKSATRNLFYTMEVVEPSADGDGHVLTMSLINLGEVSAGDSSLGDVALSSDWLLVPEIPSSAKQDFLSDTSVHREVYGKIEALERVVARDSRYLAGIEERANSAEPEIQAALQSEVTNIRIRLVTSGSMLDALRGEYQDLPEIDARYMPVTIRFGITETRSESKAMKQIAAAIKANSEMLAITAANMAGIERSLDIDFGGTELDALRTDYFDALVALEVESPESTTNTEQLKENLELAQQSYNAALVADGLPPVK